MKKFIKILLWIVGILLALVILLSLLAGPIAKGYINKHGEELTGRKVAVGHVGVNIFTGNVSVHNLSIYEEDGTTVFAGFDTLDVGAKLIKIPFHTLHFKHITLAGLHAGIEQQGERFNFSSMLDHFASDSEEEKDTTPSDWVMKFYNIRLSHAKIDYNDLTSGKNWHIPDVNLRVPGFVMGGEDEESNGGLNINFDKGGHLNMDANYDTKQNTYKVEMSLKDFSLNNIDNILSDIAKYKSLAGTVEAHITAQGHVEEIMKSRIGGTVTLKDMDIKDADGSVAGLETLAVKINNINLEANSFDIAELRLNGLNARYEQWEEYSNFSRMLNTKEPEPAASVTLQTTMEEQPVEEKKDSKPMKLHVGTLNIENTSLTYNDHTLPDPFSFPITKLNISATDLSTNGDNNAMMRATLPGGGVLMLKWNGNIDNWKQHQNLFLTIKGLDMKQLSPWSVAYTGQPIEDGIFGLTTRLEINNSQLDNKNKIDIYKASVGSRRKDVEPEMKIPLKAALYILKDKDDKILIDMPITGNIDSPEFNYMKLVWKTLGNLLVKVATSPARALGNALGFNSDDIEFMDVEPSQHGLTSEQYHHLANLASIANSDSLIVIKMEQQMPATDNDTIARRYEMRNEMIRRYLLEQGVSAKNIQITTGEPLSDPKARTGYAISSEMKIDE